MKRSIPSSRWKSTSTSPSCFADRLELRARACSCRWIDRQRGLQRRPADLAGLAERLERGRRRRARTARARSTKRVDVGRRRAEVGQHRRHLVGDRAEPHHRRRAARAGSAGSCAMSRLQLAARARRSPPRPRSMFSIERGHAAALAGERRHDRVGVDGELLELVVLAREDLEDLVDLLERRVGAADRPRRDPRRGRRGPTPSSLRMIEKRSRYGSRMMLLIRSRSTARLVFCTGSRRSPSPGPVLDLLELGRRLVARALGARRRALHEALADQRLRADLALRVAAEVLVALVVDPQDDRGLVVVGDLDVVDAADLHARDLHVLARDDEAGVVEDRADLVGVVLPARDRAPARRGRRPAGRRRRRRRVSRAGAAPGRGRSRACRTRRATARSRPGGLGRGARAAAQLVRRRSRRSAGSGRAA